jgi:hypothetical protein
MKVRIEKIEIGKNKFKTVYFKIGNRTFVKTFLRREKLTSDLLLREIA